MKFFTILIHLIIVVFLTLVTQIGGVVWCINLAISSLYNKSNKKLFSIASFILLYLLFTFAIIPPMANQFGRTPLPANKHGVLAPHTYLTVLSNRHYVTPALKSELEDIANQYAKLNPSLKTIYLDANFPFIDGFPLLPHLSHNDGKKVDLSFIYSKMEN
ncbi:MAG: hypothetical protein AAGA77_25610 [Bacteroidota bacterium]